MSTLKLYDAHLDALISKHTGQQISFYEVCLICVLQSCVPLEFFEPQRPPDEQSKIERQFLLDSYMSWRVGFDAGRSRQVIPVPVDDPNHFEKSDLFGVDGE